MATRIKILPETLTNKIAAGEVVERPSSVVKELVENAIDAGCREIQVNIEAGGKRLIKVTDDGSGMSRDEALLAMERHATSKIANDSDLFSLSTLGFRGEALPSIASVCRFTLATRERGEIEGNQIYAEGGRIKEVKSCGMAEGTSIEIRNLFFNTPARLKFLKSSETEAGHVGELLTRLALSRPDLRFTYQNEGKIVFRALPGNLKHRISELLSADIINCLYPIEYSDELISVTGYIASHECSRSATTQMYTYVNGRFIKDRVVQHAIIQAYRNLLEKGRYPVVVLFIKLAAGEVDVNVHPTKHEVRFREQGRVHDTILGALESVLRTSPWQKQKVSTTISNPHFMSSTNVKGVVEVRETLLRYQSDSAFQTSITGFPGCQNVLDIQQTIAGRDIVAESTGFFSSLTVIGQFNASYILCQNQSDLVIIDQHAAHERIAYERLRSEFDRDAIEIQGLLFTEQLELTFSEVAIVKERHHELARLGFELEHFGGNTWLLKGIPRLLTGGSAIQTLQDIIVELQKLGRTNSFAVLRDELLATIACHSVIRGQRILDSDEIMALFRQMDATDFAMSCPHGRPVYRTITIAELERMFKRG